MIFIINIANTNEGIETPITDKTVAKVSQIVFFFKAATTPSKIPTIVPKIQALSPKKKEIGARNAYW